MCQRTENHQAQRRQVWRQNLLQIPEKIPNKIKGNFVKKRKTQNLGVSRMKNIRKDLTFQIQSIY